MRRLRIAWITCAMAGAASLLLARVHPFGDAHLYAAKAADAPALQQSALPAGPRAILAAKCADCHSMQTRAPLYGRLAPASWLMERDIVKARKAMNLDQWESYSADQQQTFAAMILQRVRAKDMPPPQYRFIHWNARITEGEQQTLTQWARGTPDAAGSATTSADGGDPLRGKAVFEKRCTGCHNLEQNREGPKLRGVMGRNSGEVADFAYSAELKKAHIRWDDRSLDRWLADPDALVPGNNMEFHVSNAQERRDVIGFLNRGTAP